MRSSIAGGGLPRPTANRAADHDHDDECMAPDILPEPVLCDGLHKRGLARSFRRTAVRNDQIVAGR